MLMTYYKGGDCGKLIPNKRKGIKEKAVIQLAAEVLLALEELHK